MEAGGGKWHERKPKLLRRNGFGSVCGGRQQLVVFLSPLEFSFSCLPGRSPTPISPITCGRSSHCSTRRPGPSRGDLFDGPHRAGESQA